ncbi:Uncharacterised protein [Chryseobacterium nakagawai]|uniref:Uncharacterized protein n=1 Tax=Chryseobacterium nakagawai TaxID=1241982 RepID=A0AAD0YK60_CHRNA|nr:hypothetical protein [Chryseobacterium nakagawai]AZA90028.1 hypothetical protein EG343_05020 [Chryseobacterium nakagawai]VEH21462.1 Uncharacterised protein [Chryseobacterium nakagawai]
MKILENAVDAIEIGLEDYKSEDPRRSKSAIRNIFAGMLLLFKEKLRRMSPEGSDDVLIKQSIKPKMGSNGDWSFLGSGKKTVDVQQIKDRFGGLGIQVDWMAFDQINKLRNNIEHYYTDEAPSVVNEIVSKSFKIIRDFSKTYLEIEAADLLEQSSWDIFLEVDEVYEKEKEESIESFNQVNWTYSSLARAIQHVRCTACDSELVQAIKDQVYEPGRPLALNCKKCGNEFDLEDVLNDCLEEEFGIEAHIAIMDGGDSPYADCPDCNEPTYIFEDDCCLSCGYIQVNKECHVCGTSLDLEEAYEGAVCYAHKRLLEEDD